MSEHYLHSCIYSQMGTEAGTVQTYTYTKNIITIKAHKLEFLIQQHMNRHRNIKVTKSDLVWQRCASVCVRYLL